MSDITKLPDGSAFFTATILSKDEISKLPLKDRPISSRISSEMYHKVWESIGQASMQWNPRPSTEVFDSEGASKVAVELCFAIANEKESVLMEAVEIIESMMPERNCSCHINPPCGWCEQYAGAYEFIKQFKPA